MRTLYEMTEQYQELLQLAEAADDDEQQVFADTLEALGGELNQKVLSCAAVVRQIETIESAIKAEEERLEKRRKTMAANRDRLKSYMKDCMKKAGIEKVKGDLFTVAIQANPAAVVIEDEAAIPPTLVEVVMVRKPDKKAIAERIKGGSEVPGCRLERGESLRIR